MVLDFSEKHKKTEALDEDKLREDVERLKKLLETKEGELRATLEKGSLKDEILSVRDKLRFTRIEYEKVKEIREDKEAKASITRGIGELFTRRKAAPTKKQIDDAAQQANDPALNHQLSILINLALQKSIHYAVKIAKKIGNAYLLDRFHDALVNEFYDDLVKKKKIKLH